MARCIRSTTALLAVVSAIFLISGQSSDAAPVNYVFVPNTTLSYGGTGTLSGTFTYDIATTTLTNINVTLSGTAYSGAYDYTFDPWNTSDPTVLGLMIDANSNQIDTHMLLLYFASNLDGTPGITALTAAVGYNPNPVPGNNEVSVLGGGVALATAPIPAALPLFASGIGALGVLGWRRKRKAASRAA